MGESLASLFAVAESGNRSAADALFKALYAELHRLARGQLAKNAGQLTIGTTSLLHEAYLDMSKRDGVMFPDRARFMAYASRAMRGLIIDYARERKAQKRGGEYTLVAMETEGVAPGTDNQELTRIGDALEQLRNVEPALVQVVDLKFFCGFSFEEIAAMTGTSERTVQRQWEKARIYLHGAIKG
ncbi:MAG TPA: ECF-type sigma factor [Candidatus Polarisedimenticolaceae bacterium]|nr:ECF-type sigma factor [Candidatus Polarisedimenticolaceae bacterium]